jgi:hypothetical protein
MGGHSAWRKRVAAGGLAKGAGGVALRHRPRLGRRGKELALNRKGNLGGHGNPKKRKKSYADSPSMDQDHDESQWCKNCFFSIILTLLAYVVILKVWSWR